MAGQDSHSFSAPNQGWPITSPKIGPEKISCNHAVAGHLSTSHGSHVGTNIVATGPTGMWAASDVRSEAASHAPKKNWAARGNASATRCCTSRTIGGGSSNGHRVCQQRYEARSPRCCLTTQHLAPHPHHHQHRLQQALRDDGGEPLRLAHQRGPPVLQNILGYAAYGVAIAPEMNIARQISDGQRNLRKSKRINWHSMCELKRFDDRVHDVTEERSCL